MKRSAYLVFFVFLLVISACSYPAVRQDPVTDIKVIEERKYFLLLPIDTAPATTGLLFYPGALVEPEAYIVPSNTRYVVIEGGNHAQFGHYGPQKKDGQASIPKENQWKESADLLEAFFLELDKSRAGAGDSDRR